MAVTEDQRNRIRAIFENFVRLQIKRLLKLRIDHLNLNPFLIRVLAYQLQLNEAKEIVKWLLNQHLERGLVTSFGLALQDAAKVFSEGTGVEGADILSIKEGRHYHIQVKR